MGKDYAKKLLPASGFNENRLCTQIIKYAIMHNWQSICSFHLDFSIIYHRVRSFDGAPTCGDFNEETFTGQPCTTHHHTHFRKLFGPAYTSYFTHILFHPTLILHAHTHILSGPSVKLDNTLAQSHWLVNILQPQLQARIIWIENSFTTCKVYLLLVSGYRNICDVLPRKTWTSGVLSHTFPAIYKPGVHYLVAELSTTNLILLLLEQCLIAPDKVIEVHLLCVYYFSKWLFCTAVSYEALRSVILILNHSQQIIWNVVFHSFTTASFTRYKHRQRWHTGTQGTTHTWTWSSTPLHFFTTKQQTVRGIYFIASFCNKFLTRGLGIIIYPTKLEERLMFQ